MRKLLVLLIALVSLAAAGASATAASQTVTISATGYKPTAVSITVGDSVVFANKDAVAHTVQFKQTTGFNCSAALPLAIAAGQSASCTFTTAGKYTFSDPAHNGNKFRGTVTAATSPTSGPLTLTPKAVVYGRTSTLAGTLASKQSGQSVQIQGTECGSTASKLLTTVTTTTGGKFSYTATPLKKTAYAAQVKGSTSPAATLEVQPRLRLGKVAKHRYTLGVFAAQSFAGKLATFQRYRSSTKRWVMVKRVLLKANTTGVAPTVITSATFRSRINAKLRVRVTLGSKQVGACYLAARSNTIRS
ncbi:MAG: cupredoxin domain-containing protein [Gaiellaceae bacterium]